MNREESEKLIELKAMSDRVLDGVERVREVEDVRRETDVYDPRLRAVNAAASRAARELVDRAAAETELTHEVTDSANDGERRTIGGTEA